VATPVIGIDYDNFSEIFPLDFGAVTFKNIFFIFHFNANIRALRV
jgi:hypothetical protein